MPTTVNALLNMCSWAALCLRIGTTITFIRNNAFDNGWGKKKSSVISIAGVIRARDTLIYSFHPGRTKRKVIHGLTVDCYMRAGPHRHASKNWKCKELNFIIPSSCICTDPTNHENRGMMALSLSLLLSNAIVIYNHC